MHIDFLKKAKRLLKRRHNATKIGLYYSRASAWKMPSQIKIAGQEIRLDLNDDLATGTSLVDIFLDDDYGLNFFKSVLKNVTAIVDIGANQGLFTLAAYNIFRAKIYAYEPNNKVFAKLKYHCNFCNADACNQAVGLNNGKVELQSAKDSLHTKTIDSEVGEIEQISLTRVLKKAGNNIDLLKLDCEGAEWEILQDNECLKKVRAITMEYHTDEKNDHNSIKQILENAGFKIIRHQPMGPTWGMAWGIRH